MKYFVLTLAILLFASTTYADRHTRQRLRQNRAVIKSRAAARMAYPRQRYSTPPYTGHRYDYPIYYVPTVRYNYWYRSTTYFWGR